MLHVVKAPSQPVGPAGFVEPDRWLSRVRIGLLIAGLGTSARWVVDELAGHAALWADRTGGVDAGDWALLATLRMSASAALAVTVAFGVFLLTSRAIPGVSTARAPLRLLAVADAAATIALLVVVAIAQTVPIPLYLTFWIPVGSAAALLWRIGSLNSTLGATITAAWAKTGAIALIAWTFVGNFLLAQGAPTAIGLDIVAMGGLFTILVLATLRGARHI
jgi:hypothetical protein